MRKKIIFAIPVLLFLILGLSYFTKGLIYSLANRNVNVVPSADFSANWKTYTNINLKFSVDYPSNWKVQETKQPIMMAPYHGSRTTDITKIYFDDSFFAYVQFLSGPKFDIISPREKLIKTEQIKISGKNATKETFILESQRQETTIIRINMNNSDVYRVEALFPSSEFALIDQILSTFKFTD